jgi:hypothetical protein
MFETWQIEVGSWELEVGSWKFEIGSGIVVGRGQKLNIRGSGNCKVQVLDDQMTFIVRRWASTHV